MYEIEDGKRVILTNTGKEKKLGATEKKNHETILCETDFQSLITQIKIPWQVAT